MGKSAALCHIIEFTLRKPSKFTIYDISVEWKGACIFDSPAMSKLCKNSTSALSVVLQTCFENGPIFITSGALLIAAMHRTRRQFFTPAEQHRPSCFLRSVAREVFRIKKKLRNGDLAITLLLRLLRTSLFLCRALRTSNQSTRESLFQGGDPMGILQELIIRREWRRY